MWVASRRLIEKNSVIEYTISTCGRTLSFRDVFEGWKTHAEFREFYIKTLVDVSFSAAFWETPSVIRTSIDRPYKFVLVNSLHLANVRPDPTSFGEHFRSAPPNSNVVAFSNLGGTSKLIAPVATCDQQNYAHILAFLRTAPRNAKHELFRRIALELEAELSDDPMWISTSGLGVYWTHVRLDHQPKYYTFMPYRVVSDVPDSSLAWER